MDRISFFFLGGGLGFSLLFSAMLFALHWYYLKKSKMIKGTIVAFESVKNVYKSGNRVSYSTSIHPIIKYHFNSVIYYFRGSHQSYLNAEVNDKVDLYQLPNGPEFTIMKKNVYILFSVMIFLCLSLPFTGILYSKIKNPVEDIGTAILGMMGVLFMLRRVYKKAKNHSNENLWISFLKNKHVMNEEEFQEKKENFMFKKKLSKLKSKTHLYGIVLSTVFVTAFIALYQHMWKKLGSTKQEIYMKAFESTNDFQTLAINPEKQDFMILTILLGFVCIGLYGLVFNLIRYMRN